MSCYVSFIATWIILLAGYVLFRTFEFAVRRNIKFVNDWRKEHNLGVKGK